MSEEKDKDKDKESEVRLHIQKPKPGHPQVICTVNDRDEMLLCKLFLKNLYPASHSPKYFYQENLPTAQLGDNIKIRSLSLSEDYLKLLEFVQEELSARKSTLPEVVKYMESCFQKAKNESVSIPIPGNKDPFNFFLEVIVRDIRAKMIQQMWLPEYQTSSDLTKDEMKKTMLNKLSEECDPKDLKYFAANIEGICRKINYLKEQPLLPVTVNHVTTIEKDFFTLAEKQKQKIIGELSKEILDITEASQKRLPLLTSFLSGIHNASSNEERSEIMRANMQDIIYKIKIFEVVPVHTAVDFMHQLKDSINALQREIGKELVESLQEKSEKSPKPQVPPLQKVPHTPSTSASSVGYEPETPATRPSGSGSIASGDSVKVLGKPPLYPKPHPHTHPHPHPKSHKGT